MKGLIWTFILMLLVAVMEISAKPWNGIIPCVSSRLDAEKILGKDTVPHSEPFGTYWYKKSHIYISYLRRDRGAPANDIVQKIDVYRDESKSILLAEFVKNIPGFPKGFNKREMDPKVADVGYLAFYINADEGFDIVVQKNEQSVEIVSRFVYYGLDSACSKSTPNSSARKSDDF